jgi:hypothetical protein
MAGTASRKREERCILGRRWPKKQAVSGFGRGRCGRGRIPRIQSLQPFLYLARGMWEEYVLGRLSDAWPYGRSSKQGLTGSHFLCQSSCRLISMASGWLCWCSGAAWLMP